MSIAKHHSEWLSLIEVSGPFLSLPVLVQRFPQGMDAHEPEHARALRQVYEEWDQYQHGDRPAPAIHRQWIDWVLRNTLDLGDVLVEGQKIPQTLRADLPLHGETLRPDMVILDPSDAKPRLLIQTYPLKQKLSRVVEGRPWAASPDTRMMQLLHDTGVRIGLVTNGEQWMLVDAPKGETTGYASWYASLWLEEPKTLQAFRTLLGSYRFFGVPEEETLEKLLSQSAQDQQELTDQLGYQVRQAVEVLVRSIDRANRDSGGVLLKGVKEENLYEATLTVMMRLVFLFCAEERDLLLLGDELYDKNYAVSTLREQLRVTATNFGEEVLERRHDAWSRLLTTFRAVYGGIQHQRIKLPAYNGELFDPDRFPFLEGRPAGTTWKDTPCQPIPVDNRTTLHLLEALQVLQVRLPGGGPATPRKLSFRALSILQIGHVYEGLLDHTAVKATEPVLGLNGPRDHEPEVPLSKLEALAAKGETELLAFLKEETGRSSVSPIKKLLSAKPDDLTLSRFRTACQGDETLWQRVKPFAGLVRLDTFDYPVVVLPGSLYVTAGTDRRSSGTHYTPESLTEPIVRHTLEPLVYEGPAEGKPKEQWRLKSPRELLDLKVCDMACGSGAFLVQVCIYLAERLLEAWEAEKKVEGTPRITPYGEVSTGGSEEQLIPLDRQERLAYARRLVAERCVYGVDKNPLAVEMAKLSLWLLTLAKDKPFTFLDHAIRCGDSLVGLSSIDQLLRFSMTENAKVRPLMEQQRQQIEKRLQATTLLRKQIETLPSNTPQDVERKVKMLENVEDQTKRLRYAADMLLAATWEAKNVGELESALNGMLAEVEYKFKDLPVEQLEAEAKVRLRKAGIAGRFHWPLEFPESFVSSKGFDAIMGNPPYMGGRKINGSLGDGYRDHLVAYLGEGQSGHADLCAYFLLRAATLVREAAIYSFVATSSISEGVTRESSLDILSRNGSSIIRADPKRTWPGSASVTYSLVWIAKDKWQGDCVLSEKTVSGISTLLAEEVGTAGKPQSLYANVGMSFQGSILLGSGFIIDEAIAKSFIERNPANERVLFPYLTGEELNGSPTHTPHKWAISFFDWPLDREGEFAHANFTASDFPDCLEHVRASVFHERQGKSADIRKAPWWQFWRARVAMYDTIRKREWVLGIATAATKYVQFAVLPTSMIFGHTVTIISPRNHGEFAVLSSAFHETWARQYASYNLSLLRYTPTDCFVTFPFPLATEELSALGCEFQTCRSQAMSKASEGLTATYNRVHDETQSSANIIKLRDFHVEIDESVSAAYGWSDLKLDHGFHETKQGTRFTISEAARREVLTRLLKLNHERHAEEVAQGLHDKGKGKPKAAGRKGKKASSSDESLLF